MAEYTVGKGGNYPTLSAAAKAPDEPPPDPDPEPQDWIAMSLVDFEEIRAAVATAYEMLENMAADTGRE